MNFEEIPIQAIDLGERRREEYGDIDRLAAGIKRVGLLEPVIVDKNGSGRYRLVAGGRRLKAVQLLGWRTIPAQLCEHLTEAELRDIELEENENRKDLTERERARRFESAKKLIEQAKRVAEIISTGAVEKDSRGRKATLGAPKEAIAEALNTSVSALVRAEQQVETATRFPWMQVNNWRQSDVLRVHEQLTEMKPEVSADVVTVLNTAKILDPQLTTNLIRNVRAMKPADRQEVVRLSQSEDPRDRSLALTKAARLPPDADPRLNILEAALESLRRASKPFPKDPLTPRIEAVIQEVKKIHAAVREVSYNARRDENRSALQ